MKPTKIIEPPGIALILCRACAEKKEGDEKIYRIVTIGQKCENEGCKNLVLE